MSNEITPESRRAIIAYAAKENLSFDVALECIVMEGIKIINNDSYTPVDNHVHK